MCVSTHHYSPWVVTCYFVPVFLGLQRMLTNHPKLRTVIVNAWGSFFRPVVLAQKACSPVIHRRITQQKKNFQKKKLLGGCGSIIILVYFKKNN